MQGSGQCQRVSESDPHCLPKGIIISDTETNDLVEDVSIYRYKNHTKTDQNTNAFVYHNLKNHSVV